MVHPEQSKLVFEKLLATFRDCGYSLREALLFLQGVADVLISLAHEEDRDVFYEYVHHCFCQKNTVTEEQSKKLESVDFDLFPRLNVPSIPRAPRH